MKKIFNFRTMPYLVLFISSAWAFVFGTRVGNQMRKQKATILDVLVEEYESMSYGAFFSATTTRNYQRDNTLNETFIRCQQQFANDLLLHRGHVFLNDVHDMLGLPRTTPGALVGWIMRSNEDYIDLGATIYAPYISLTFNVQGVIFDKIEEYQ